MAVLKCKMCGGTLDVTEGMTVCECEYCGTKQTITTSNDENMQALFNRANILRMKSEFDKAEALYEKLVQKSPDDAEAHWGLILCKYGIEYVEDPDTFKRVPTCHRTSFDSIIADEDYKEALRCADTVQRSIYEAEAKEIDRLQKEILALSAKEEPYDVFICYKESDNGTRTPDSVIANDIYHQLTNEGFKVFYSAITLEDKLGSAYEPCIFAALNSAKVMLAIGTKPEYFNAVWVKNEWSRYLKMMKKDRSKLLIPCYKDMDAYELPEEFAHLQAQDMSKIGFINDIVRGIKKVIVKDEPKAAAPKAQPAAPVPAGNPTANSLVKRAFIFLEDGDWSSADEYCEKALDIDPENAQAYLGKLMAELKVKKRDNLKKRRPFDSSGNYQKALKFGSNELKTELQGYIAYINNDIIYKTATVEFKCKNYSFAKKQFEKIRDYRDSAEMISECDKLISGILAEKDDKYNRATAFMSDKKYKDAIDLFLQIIEYKDSDKQIINCLEQIISSNSIFEQRLADCRNKMSHDKTEKHQIEMSIRKIKYNIQKYTLNQQELKKKQAEKDLLMTKIKNAENELSALGFFAGAKKKKLRAEIDSYNAELTTLNGMIPTLENQINSFDLSANSQSQIDILNDRAKELQKKIDQSELKKLESELINNSNYQKTEFGYVNGKQLFIYNEKEIDGNICKYIENNDITDIVILSGSSIMRKTFYGCESLKSVVIGNSVTSIGGCAFESCKSLTSVTIPDSVTSIGYSAFGKCESLTSVTIPDSVTSIEGHAFEGCTSLTSITIPDSVRSIAGGAFDDTKWLTNQTQKFVIVGNNVLLKYNGSDKSVIIPDSVRSIADGAFQSCKSLTSVTIPDSVTSIGDCAFEGCTSLTSIIIPDSVTSIGESAFEGCTSLTSVTIPDSVMSIGYSAFGECESLTSVTIPDSVTSTGDCAFEGCTSLTSIIIPDSVTSIGDCAFKTCKSLTSVTIPDSVTSIGNEAFEDCTSLTSVTIPDSVTSIGGWAFESCKSLTSVTIPDSVMSIGYRAFGECESLTSVTIPDSVTSIEDHAFEGCTSLTSVRLPKNVKIGTDAFKDTEVKL